MWQLENKYIKEKKAIGGLFGGGDVGGDAAEIQQQFNQQAIDEIKRQFGITQENIAPFLDAGTGALPDVIEGATVGGLDSRLAEIFNTDTFGSLVEERQRGVQGQLAAGGLMRSGAGIQAAADVSSDLALQIEQLLTGRATNLANTGVNSALGLGQVGANATSQISSLLSSSGRAGASGAITDGQADAKGASNLFKVGGAIAGFFSDPRLKDSVKQIGKIGRLKTYTWKWKEEVKSTMVGLCPTIGFMANEVKELYPQFVGTYAGFDVINYDELIKELEVV